MKDEKDQTCYRSIQSELTKFIPRTVKILSFWSRKRTSSQVRRPNQRYCRSNRKPQQVIRHHPIILRTTSTLCWQTAKQVSFMTKWLPEHEVILTRQKTIKHPFRPPNSSSQIWATSTTKGIFKRPRPEKKLHLRPTLCDLRSHSSIYRSRIIIRLARANISYGHNRVKSMTLGTWSKVIFKCLWSRSLFSITTFSSRLQIC